MKKFLSMTLATCAALACFSGCGTISSAPPEEIDIPDGYVKEGNYLFEEDVLKDGYFYNYCPSILQDGDTRYLYYCANEQPNVVVD